MEKEKEGEREREQRLQSDHNTRYPLIFTGRRKDHPVLHSHKEPIKEVTMLLPRQSRSVGPEIEVVLDAVLEEVENSRLFRKKPLWWFKPICVVYKGVVRGRVHKEPCVYCLLLLSCSVHTRVKHLVKPVLQPALAKNKASIRGNKVRRSASKLDCAKLGVPVRVVLLL